MFSEESTIESGLPPWEILEKVSETITLLSHFLQNVFHFV